MTGTLRFNIHSIEHEIREVCEKTAQFSYDILQLTQSLQAYEGAPELGPSYLRHVKTLFLDLNYNQVNILHWMHMMHANLMHHMGLDKQNGQKANQERLAILAGLNQLMAQYQMVNTLIQELLVLEDKLRQQYKLTPKPAPKQNQHPVDEEPDLDFLKRHKAHLEIEAHLARTAPYPHPFPHHYEPVET